MSDPRRYTDREIAAIFKLAAEAQDEAQRTVPTDEGLTLSELQAIGREAGITPAFIARAAAAVESRAGALPPETYAGLPISAARTVELPGPFTDEDWDRLVADLRRTFAATGKVRRDGTLRQWSNGNLRALVEPTDTGHRLHLRTRKGDASSAVGGSAALVALAVLMFAVVLGGGGPAAEPVVAVVAALFALFGVGLMARSVYALPRWADERARQMEAVAGRAMGRPEARAAASLPEAERPAVDLAPGDELPEAVAARPAARTRS